MIAEIGQFWLIATMILSFVAMVSVGYGIIKSNERWSMAIFPLSLLSCLFCILSISALGYGFYIDDFSIRYIAEHSNSALPVFFKIAAIWGGHEGSLLFWVLTLTLWAGLITLNRKRIEQAYVIRVLLVLNTLIVIFSAFTLFASNPFIIYVNTPVEGRDLNPMLQDIGLIFHPPLLYLGYVGFAATFSFALAALMMKEVPSAWVRYARNWTLLAWALLTAGISLGSWWAYYELGWGGWWFWDPVENASLLPWLTATALLHTLIVSHKQQQLLKTSVVLALLTFSLSILGTFVVRSGVLTSVHAFAVDPTRGIILLLILFAVLLVSFSLYALKSKQLNSKSITELMSRDFLFLLLAGLFSIATITVLLGTFYPMIFQILGLGNISVGAPYFNLLFVPMAIIALLMMAVSIFVQWHKKTEIATKRNGLLLGLGSIICGFIIYRLQYSELFVVPLIIWVLAVAVVGGSLWTIKQSQGKALGMAVAHIGVAVVMIGAAMNAEHSFETSAKMEPGITAKLADYEITYVETDLLVASNYTAEQANLVISEEGKKIATVQPQRRHYQVRVMNMSEPAMHWFWHGDIYVTLGEKLKDGSFALRLQYKAYVRWVWFGSILMALGGIIAIIKKKKAEEA
ncbi:heme lyase CcmF/NrfE family subunit [Aliivibrio sp. S4TY2]|uniref:heme lyase CcmF/NrfE family subunit n=1 Tax=unclassified Aliivibrio TaxID=2645654 RepID=UPI0023793962|nr:MULTISPECIES: heme lyase CcmF/NrfE family subunit [unclassified Aliivibrio]MDD9155503.1 heme lyase CcmF/NrfE family subunit [Aliivibrio sp. S4TY2]MDD9160370.1 heme lyase CcmF/NrfE family subunit [Aliivibrio sp. S4TY1]MDD9164732.1 heme lyase CcmF/NrfE family subunit [Aliivibrio sp. S4MY2]MDD9168538.1 heme lyase CcmF/NrfE family subunit [Aliivibrio sp. S4MY4]MDD9185066.1 heme lyase CcmF/NrfE family subunit [Aliivibrio sp. S4MY3]